MKKKLKVIVPLVALVAVVAVYKMVLTAPEETHAKVKGEVYVLPSEFVVNLDSGRFAKLTVALVLDEGHSAAGGGGHGETAPPEGFGPLPQEPLVREIVTDTLTGVPAVTLTSRQGRHELEEKIEKTIDRETDVHTDSVLFTDLVVQ
jgi:flagellar basal body-associated protein FliL